MATGDATSAALSTNTPATSSPPLVSVEIITNGDFELSASSALGWTTDGDGVLNITTDATKIRSGIRALYVTDRQYSWGGPLQSILGVVMVGETVKFSGFERHEGPGSQDLMFTAKMTDLGGTHYYTLSSGLLSPDVWEIFQAEFIVPTPNGTMTELAIYFEGPPPGVNLNLDAISGIVQRAEILNATSVPSSNPTAPTTTMASINGSGTITAAADHQMSSGSNETVIIVGATLGSIFGVLCLVTIACFLIKGRRGRIDNAQE